MKISDPNQRIQLEAYTSKAQAAQIQQQQQQQNGVQGSDKARSADKVEISSESRLMSKLNAALQVQDPERAAKVNAIKDQIQQGTYQVDPEKVAQGMLTDILKDLG